MSQAVEMDWYERAKAVFDCPKPERFVNCSCLECREHQRRLSATDVDRITLTDMEADFSTITMAAPEAQKYYLPALVRMTLDTIEISDLVSSFILILANGASENRLLQICNAKQAEFVRLFLENLMLNHPEQMEQTQLVDLLLDCHQVWTVRAEEASN